MTTDSTERLPTRGEIASDSIHGSYAVKHFHGKTLAQAVELFAYSARAYIPLAYIEDLAWMEPVGFRFYIARPSALLSRRAPTESATLSTALPAQ